MGASETFFASATGGSSMAPTTTMFVTLEVTLRCWWSLLVTYGRVVGRHHQMAIE